MNETVNLTPEQIYEQFEYLTHTTVHRMLKNPNKIAKSKSLEADDIFQYARLGLWQGCQTYHTAKHNSGLRSFLIRNIRWVIHQRIRDEGVEHLRWKTKEANDQNKVNLLSLDAAPNADTEMNFHELVGNDYILEGEVVGKVLTEMIEKKYPDRTVNIVKKRAEGYTLKEIGDEIGLTRERVRQILKKVRTDLVGVM